MSRLFRSPLFWILGWSFAVHLPGLTSPLLDHHAHRQCQTASMSRYFARHGMQFFHPEVAIEGPLQRTGTEFPIYSYLAALLYLIFGEHVLLGRLLSILFTACSAVFLYQLVCRRLGHAVALWSALILSVIPVHLYFTRAFMPEPMALWGVIGFAWAADRWLSGGKRSIDWLAALLLGATGPWLKLPYLYLVGGLWAVFCLEDRSRLRDLRWWALAVGIVALPGSWYAWAHTAPIQVLPFGSDYHRENLSSLLHSNLWKTQFISRFPELCSTYTGLALGLWGAVQLRSSKIFFIGWWLITFLYILLCGQYGVIHQYTAIPWAPINATLIAYGAVALWRASGPIFWRRALIALLVLGIPIHAALRVRHWYRLERLYLFKAREVVASLSKPDDLFLTNTREIPVLLYSIDRAGWARDLRRNTPEEIDAVLRQGVRFMLTPVDETWRAQPEWSAFFAKRGRLAYADTEFLIYELL